MRRSFLAIAVLYGLLFAALFYWQLCAEIESHPANPRYYQMFKEKRGAIYDRSGLALAESVPEGETFARVYSAPSLSHVVGYFHQRYGMTGLERLLHEDLSQGRSVITTLDLQVQKAAEEAINGREGAVVVMRPATGEVLALVSSPWVDGNELDDNWPDYLDDQRSPFLNRATHGLYPPGSTVKPIIYGSALAGELTGSGQIWEDGGSLTLKNRTISNFGGRAHGKITTDQALALSSNVVFARLAMELGEGLLEAFRAFGLGSQVKFDLANLGGHLPGKAASDYDLAQLGIGQGELLVTPLQMAAAVSAIANGGTMMRPYLVQEVRGGLKLRQITRPERIADVLPSFSAQALSKAMALAASEGTARTDSPASFSYGGKTGTAQMGQGLDHAWFIGFAPVEDPQIAVAVLIEHGGSGSQAAVPIGVRVMEAALTIDE